MNAQALRIESVTGVDVEYEIAGVGTRSYAFLIDIHIRLIVAAAVFFGLLYVPVALSLQERGLLAALPYLAYHPLLEILLRGSTPGKRMAGVRIVTMDGETPGVAALLVRNVFRLFDSLPMFYIVGLVCTVVTARNTRVGDLAAGTVLVRTGSARDAIRRVATAVKERQLSPEAAELADDLLQRWNELDAAHRSELARRFLVRATHSPGLTDELAAATEADLKQRLATLRALPAQGMATGAVTGTVTAVNPIQSWMADRVLHWRGLERTLGALRRDHGSTTAEALVGIEAYRGLARDYSIARRNLPNSGVTAGLADQYAALHALIHRPWHPWLERLRLLFVRDVPGITHGIRLYIGIITGLFISTGVAGWALITEYPELISLFASESMIRTVESGRLWTDDLLSIVPPAFLSVSILSNNIAVSLFAFCSGVLFGLGTFYIIGMNGFMLGAIFAFTHQHQLADSLFRFVIAHGVVELSVICLAGAAGMYLGESLVRPTAATRGESFRRAVAFVGPLVLFCALLLVGCGFIEGYVSPNPAYPIAVRVAIGIGYGLLMMQALTGRLYPSAWRT